MENTDVKEIRELVADNQQKLEISLRVAELPTTTPIEVPIHYDILCSVAITFDGSRLILFTCFLILKPI